MRKNTFIVFLLFTFLNCKSQEVSNQKEKAVENSVKVPISDTILNSITINDLRKHLTILASDSLEGRMTGEIGQKKTVDYLKKMYQNLGIESPISKDDYFQEIPGNFIKSTSVTDTENVLAYIPGTDNSGEFLVISAHLDHLGKGYGKGVYNGADDNGSGTSALLEIAQAFKEAEKIGIKPKKGILFLHVTAEELGLYGSKFYVENPILPLEKTICNINIDMIGRRDDKNSTNPNYLYVIGPDRITKELNYLVLETALDFKKIKLDYSYDVRDEPLNLYERSDHYNFAKKDIPVAFFFSGLHDDYHQPTDDVDKIEFTDLQLRTQYIFQVVWNIVNRDSKFGKSKRKFKLMKMLN